MQTKTLPHLIASFSDYILSEKGLSLNTTMAYKRDLLKLHAFLKEEGIAQVRADHFTQFLGLLKDKGLSSNSIRRLIFSCRVFFRYLEKEFDQKVSFLSHLKAPSTWEKVPQVLTEADIETLLKYLEKEEERVMERALIELLYATGLRVSELCSLNWADVSGEVLVVKGKGSKDRLVPVGNLALKALKDYRATFKEVPPASSPLFRSSRGKRVSRQGVWHLIKRCIKASGITKEISPHSFRHTFATHLLEGGADLRVIQDFLGHSDITTTDRYTHLSMKKMVTDFHKFHPKRGN